jgi:hypothetical protein
VLDESLYGLPTPRRAAFVQRNLLRRVRAAEGSNSFTARRARLSFAKRLARKLLTRGGFFRAALDGGMPLLPLCSPSRRSKEAMRAMVQ